MLEKYPESRQVFFGTKGQLLQRSDKLVQPYLARTLEKLSEQGADYLHEGLWADEFITKLNGLGGRFSQSDLETCQPVWTEPLKTNFRGFDIFAPGLLSFGGISNLEAMNLLEIQCDPEQHYTRSADDLYWFVFAAKSCGTVIDRYRLAI